MGDQSFSGEQKPGALFPNVAPTSCVLCKVQWATCLTDSTCDTCSLVVAGITQRRINASHEMKMASSQDYYSPVPPPPPIPVNINLLSESTYQSSNTSASTTASSVLSQSTGLSRPSRPSPSFFVDELLARQGPSLGIGSTLRNHGYRLVVDWGLCPPSTNIPTILSSLALPSGLSATVPKKFFTADPKEMLQHLSVLRNQFLSSSIEHQAIIFVNEIIQVKASFNKVIRDNMKLALLDFSCHHLESCDYIPATSLSSLDNLEMELKSNRRPNWLKWYTAICAHHSTLWRKGRTDNCNLDVLTLRCMDGMGISYRCQSNEPGAGCFRKAATRVFHNLSTHLKTFLHSYHAQLGKVSCISGMPWFPRISSHRFFPRPYNSLYIFWLEHPGPLPLPEFRSHACFPRCSTRTFSF
jgi:hypothetical protein